MISRLLITICALLFSALLLAQLPPRFPREDIPRMPDGKSRRLAILKADHEKSLEDIAEIIQLAREVEESFEKNQEHVLDLKSLEKMEQIEKLSKKIQSRMKRLR